jgi:diguanylate cyclase (GGDEF)-like protein/PAS domain S-box-containing protein
MEGFRVTAVITGLLTVAHVSWVAANVGGDEVSHAVARSAAVATAGFTLCACLRARQRHAEAARRGWGFLAATAACWLLANAIDGWNELRGGTLPVPSAGDLPITFGVVLAVVAMLAFLTPALSSAARMRTLLDGLLIGSALLFVGWVTVLEEAYRAAGEGPERVVALFIPLGDLVIMALILVTATRVRAGSRLPWALLATGLLLIMTGDTLLAYLKLAASYTGGSLPYSTWVAGCLLVGLAALLPTGSTAPISEDPKPGRALQVVVPYVPVLVAGAVALVQASSGAVDTFLITNGAVLVVLLLARQVLSQLENLDLARALDSRVKERTEEVNRQREQFHALVRNATDVVTVVDGTGIVRYQSVSVERVLGFRFSELIGTRLAELVHPDDRSDMAARMAAAAAPPSPPLVVEGRMRKKDGTWAMTETTVSDLRRDENVRGLLLTTRDVSDRKVMLDELRHRALHDPLTGLGNRILFRDRLDHAVARAVRSPQSVAVLMVDLDGFKGVNDSLGHAAGDQLLREVAQRLRTSVRPGDTVARMGGDEFAILIEAAPSDTATTVAQRIINRLRAPIELEGKPIVCQGSVGISAGSTAAGAEELLRHADLAMYAAKQSGKGRYAAFDPSMLSVATERVELEADLRRAVRERTLGLAFQPIVRMPHGVISGAEALVRWEHPKRGNIPPTDFIPLAEESDLIVELGRFVLIEACRAAKRFQDAPEHERFSVSVNVAARQLVSPWLVKEVREALEETELEPDSLVLEITEGALMDDARAIVPALQSLKNLGVQLAIDDFGTGWSSLSRLRSFPVDKLKIDRSFVNEIRAAHDDAPIATAVIAMAHSLSLTTVAEGVETAEQLAFLHQHGCEEVQGFLLGRPMAADALVALLSEPTGLLQSGVVASERGELTEREQGIMSVVAGAMVPGRASEVVAPVLAELQKASGVDAVYFAEIDWTALTQTVRFAVAEAGGPALPEGFTMEWEGSPAARMLAGGPATVSDLTVTVPGNELVRGGGRGYVGVPVRSPDDKVVGVLCGLTAAPRDIPAGTVTLFDLFARLLLEHVGRSVGSFAALV